MRIGNWEITSENNDTNVYWHFNHLLHRHPGEEGEPRVASMNVQRRPDGCYVLSVITMSQNAYELLHQATLDRGFPRQVGLRRSALYFQANCSRLIHTFIQCLRPHEHTLAQLEDWLERHFGLSYLDQTPIPRWIQSGDISHLPGRFSEVYTTQSDLIRSIEFSEGVSFGPRNVTIRVRGSNEALTSLKDLSEQDNLRVLFIQSPPESRLIITTSTAQVAQRFLEKVCTLEPTFVQTKDLMAEKITEFLNQPTVVYERGLRPRLEQAPTTTVSPLDRSTHPGPDFVALVLRSQYQTTTNAIRTLVQSTLTSQAYVMPVPSVMRRPGIFLPALLLNGGPLPLNPLPPQNPSATLEQVLNASFEASQRSSSQSTLTIQYGSNSEQLEALGLGTQVPKAYCCSISLHIMTEPMIDPRCPKYPFERKVIEEHLRLNPTHPITRQALSDTDLVLDLEKKREIERYMKVITKPRKSADDKAYLEAHAFLGFQYPSTNSENVRELRNRTIRKTSARP